jgi:hypothetical protein
MAAALAALAALGAASVAGCGGGEKTEQRMISLVPIATARDVWNNVAGLLEMSIGSTDPSCPVVTTDGTMTTYTGGCTDAAGATWSGVAVVDGLPGGDFTVSWSSYSLATPVACGGGSAETSDLAEGSASLYGTGTSMRSFEVDVRVTRSLPGAADCALSTSGSHWVYVGTIGDGPDPDGNGLPNGEIFDGAGVVERTADGDTFAVNADTLAQLVDRVACDQEPLSGTTTLTTLESDRGHVGSLTNDGATDCDDPPMGRWTYEGEDHGEVAVGGVCSMARLSRAGRPAAPAVLLAAAALAAALRRTRRSVRRAAGGAQLHRERTALSRAPFLARATSSSASRRPSWRRAG